MPGRLGSSVKPAFGAGGAYVETVSRTTFTSFRHRLYRKGNAGTAYLAMIPNYKIDDMARFEATMRTITADRSVILIGDKAKRTFPLQPAALQNGPTGVQVSAQIVGATMADLQATKRIEISFDGIGRVEQDVAMGLQFDLAGDRRKIGIAARSCVR
ncbi:hypothetical protein [Bradyrhizobium sp. SZCCHNR1070]|uniref:hypothetical protein n=1 Tax=Bradyrhizobium sp. SZCCHNR1070 TaxID=3057361 RepID=UPI0029161C31|nr:hypothetical protein [Bradyrhizobium sp. SZCCHNR1070]